MECGGEIRNDCCVSIGTTGSDVAKIFDKPNSYEVAGGIVSNQK